MKLIALLLAAATASTLAQNRFPIRGLNVGDDGGNAAVQQPRGQFNAHPVDDETAAALKALANRVATHRAETHEDEAIEADEAESVPPAGAFVPPSRAARRDLSDEELLAAVQELAGGAAPLAAKEAENTSPAVTEQYNEIAETLKRRRLCSAGQYYTKQKGKWFKKSVRCCWSQCACVYSLHESRAQKKHCHDCTVGKYQPHELRLAKHTGLRSQANTTRPSPPRAAHVPQVSFSAFFVPGLRPCHTKTRRQIQPIQQTS